MGKKIKKINKLIILLLVTSCSCFYIFAAEPEPDRDADIISDPANFYDFYVFDQSKGMWVWSEKNAMVQLEPSERAIKHIRKRKTRIVEGCTRVNDWHDPDQEPLSPCREEIPEQATAPIPTPTPPTPTLVAVSTCTCPTVPTTTENKKLEEEKESKSVEVTKVQKKKLGFFARVLKRIVQLILDVLFAICQFFIWILNQIES